MINLYRSFYRKSKYLALLVFFCLMFSLSSCGFHLQGETHLAKPLHKLYLQTRDPYGVLARNLRESLKMSHVKIVECPALANTTLEILQDNNVQTLLGVNSTTQTRQYELRLIVTFIVNDKHNQPLIPAQTMIETRVITVQSNQILGSSNEENLYYQQMRRIIATAIMQRLASKEITTMLNMQKIP